MKMYLWRAVDQDGQILDILVRNWNVIECSDFMRMSASLHAITQVKDIHRYLTVSLSLMSHPILYNVHSKKSARELIFFMGNPM